MNKKGSMELSVNSIVILVIAIVMLGLILGFVRSKFSDISKNVDMEESAPIPATGSNPLTASRTLVVLSPGEKTVLRLSYYETSGAVQSLEPTMLCSPGTSPAAPYNTVLNVLKDSIIDTPVDYSIRIVGGSAKDVYICTITMGAVTKDITVKVV